MQPHEFGVNKRDVILLRMRAYHLLEVTKGCVLKNYYHFRAFIITRYI